MKRFLYSSKRFLSSRSFGRYSEFVFSATLIIIFRSVPMWLIIFIGIQISSAEMFFHSLRSNICRRLHFKIFCTSFLHTLPLSLCKKVYFFCTCAILPIPLCKHRSGNAFTSCRTVPMRLSEQCRYLHYPQKQQTAYSAFWQNHRMM